MALERVPADIRRDGGVARMSDPALIEGIKAVVTMPVMAKARIGHFAEAQILQSLGVDFVDESEVLTPADEAHHIDKWAFEVPFVCGATNLGEALRRISEGAAMIRSKGEAGTGDVVHAVRHLRQILGDIRAIGTADSPSATAGPRNCRRRSRSSKRSPPLGKLPVPMFCAGGIATPADAALVMQLGAEAVFVGSGIFKSDDPARRAAAIVEATTHYIDADVVAKVSRGLGEAMRGIDAASVEQPARGPWLVSVSECPQVRVGILALQGAVGEHADALSTLGAEAGNRPARPNNSKTSTRSCCPVASRPPCRCCSSRVSLFDPLLKSARRRVARARYLRRHDPLWPPMYSTAALISATSV